MTRAIVEPTTDERGQEEHPAWVLVGASRVSANPPVVLFDSDIRHSHYVLVRVKRATRQRDLSRDWTHGRETIVEFAMSEAQWASFVSSMNTGDGVPATLEWDATRDNPYVPGMPHAPRLQVSMDEVHNAAASAQEKVQVAFAAYAEKKSAANLRELEIAISHMTPNMDYAAKSLSEHAENVVQRSRADVEAFVMQKAQQLGLEPGDLGELPELTAGTDERPRWVAEYRHPDGRVRTDSITATTYSAAKVAARNGETDDGFVYFNVRADRASEARS